MKYAIWTALLILSASVSAQIQIPDNPHPATKGTERLKSAEKKNELTERSITQGLQWDNIGPTVMSGRVTDIEVDPKDAAHFFVSYASGGLWETSNNGTTFTPVFDQSHTLTIGDFAVNWSTNEIWVGTGEANSSRSSYAGYGIYYSPDKGQTWEHKGLEESHHIGKVIVDPVQPKTVYVASLGHLYSSDNQRGLYKTTDGGQHWEQVLFVNENTGIIDLVQDPQNPDIMYAAAWEKSRRAWNFWESGEGSGIYKSTNRGKTWKSITTQSGFPSGQNAGRIALALYSQNGQTVLYALVDNQSRFHDDQEPTEGMNKKAFIGMKKNEFLSIPDSVLGKFLKDNDFPEKYSVKEVKQMVSDQKIVPEDLYKYLTDANAALFDDPVRGAELYRTDNGGESWNKTHEDILEQVYYSYGYYFGLIQVDPVDPQRVYIAGVPLLKSVDGGKTFTFIGENNVHVDHHCLWVNKNKPGHLINGNDGGINISYDTGKSWIKCNSPAVGQFYTVAVGSGKNYAVYGGLQDNGTWQGPHTYQHSTQWHQTGHYPYKMLNGGDGMQVQVDDIDGYVYTGYQFGHYSRIDSKTGQRLSIHPHHELGEEPLRWNWQTPIWLSRHNNTVLYMGSNKFHRSLDQGKTFKTMSSDLTKGGKKGDVSFGTITTIHESPLEFGLLATGTDDGLVHVSEDGGKTWTNVSKGLPQDMWVSRVIYSAFSRNRIYVTLNGYRWDNFDAMVYVSEDNGRHWKKIGNDLPDEPVNVIREDPSVENLLYLGTDNGVYISHDRGQTFASFGSGLPPVAIHDIAIQDEQGDCIVATHGRSLYRLNINPLRILDTLNQAGYILAHDPVRHNKDWGQMAYNWSFEESRISIYFVINPEVSLNDSVDILIVDDQNNELYNLKLFVSKGVNVFRYDLSVDTEAAQKLNFKQKENGKYYLKPGKYKTVVRLSADQTFSGQFEVKD